MTTGQKHPYEDLGRLSVLVAEDHEINRFLISRIIESWGFDITLAENGLEVLEKIKEKQFDLILMDIQMPEMDGIAATKNIRALADKTKSSTPIIAVTANIQPGAKEEYREAGMNMCISKPINEKELLNKIYNLIKGEAESPAESIPEASVSVDENKLYDLSLIRSLSGGDEEFVTKMVKMFLETMPVSLHTLETSVRNKDWKSAGNIAHKMKSGIDTMGIFSLKEDIRIIENNSRQMRELEIIPSATLTVSKELSKVMNALRKDFNLA